MNKIYKVIWSKVKHCYVVTSELAKSHTKSATTGSSHLVMTVGIASLFCAAFMTGGVVYAAMGSSFYGSTAIDSVVASNATIIDSPDEHAVTIDGKNYSVYGAHADQGGYVGNTPVKAVAEWPYNYGNPYNTVYAGSATPTYDYYYNLQSDASAPKAFTSYYDTTQGAAVGKLQLNIVTM